ATARLPSCPRCAVQTPVRAEDYSGTGPTCIVISGKAVELAEQPGAALVHQLEDRAAISPPAAVRCCSIEISCSIQRQAGVRVSPVLPAGEGMDHIECLPLRR